MSEDTHFNVRCRERGIEKTDTRLLHQGLTWAIQSGRDDLVEMVMRRDDIAYYRFRCVDGIFYAIVGDNGLPRTVITQDMMRKKKFAQKRQKHGHLRGRAR